MPRRNGSITLALLLAVGPAGCGGQPVAPAPVTDPAAAFSLLTALAHDSLEGRATGTPGALKASTIIAREMARAGLTPAGDSGFFQRLPLIRGTRTIRDRQISGPMVVATFAARDSLPPEQWLPGANVVGLLPGADAALAGEYILVGAHYDHIGIRAPVNGDSINNGADDDASGVVAILRIADELAKGPAPRRTILFVAWIGEESGLLGARWFADHPVRPLDQMVANLEIEMIGRPDSLIGGPGKAWLTGFERTTLGDSLVAAGLPIVADPRPAQNFFRRSDNYQFAEKGIVAQTISSFGLHLDYHRPSDDASRIDSLHMARVIDTALRAVRILANGPRPQWKPGGRPTPGS